ncbi:MAG: PhoH family protein [Clostridiales bacterium]|nr:PhoH family protein [Clostridiales bacterium]
MNQTSIDVTNVDVFMKLAGNLDANFDYIEKALNVELSVGNNEIVIKGDLINCDKGKELIENLIEIILIGDELDTQKIDYSLELINDNSENRISEFYKTTICVTKSGQPVNPKTLGQKKYIDMINNKDLIFGIGPAGTGKTYIAVAMAIRAFKNGRVKRIIITRPAIEAGENLGFLPGDLQSKVDPYLRPIYDAMEEILGTDVFQNYRERGLVEIAPLAYMRGRTLDHAFIILDEAQNTTTSQMKMFLTRFGFGSKVVINGDVTQIDLNKEVSGLSHALHILKDIEEIGIMEFTERDVMRHSLVKKIITQYDQYETNGE